MLVVLLFACAGKEVGGDTAALTATAEVVSLTVSPDGVTVAGGPDGGTPIPFIATAQFADGSVAPMADVEWSLSNSVVGTIDAAGIYTPAAEAAGDSYVTARFAGVEDTVLLTLVYTDEIVTEGVDTSVFAAAEVPTEGLWLYPEDGVGFPRNTPSIEFQWVDVAQTAARLRFKSGVTDVTVYTTGTAWTADEETWQRIAATNAGGSVTVDLALAVGGQVLTAVPLTLSVNRMDGVGTVYYWSVDVEGFMRIPYGGAAEEFLTENQTGVCQGCHDIVGDRLVYTYGQDNGYMGVRTISSGVDEVTRDLGLQGTYKTWSPDGKYLLSTFAGSMLLYETTTWTLLYEVPLETYAVMPDWSPDGSSVVFVLADTLDIEHSITGGRIAVVEFLGEAQFGTPTVIYDPAEGNAYYPAWSPDGEWIAFDQSNGDSYDDTDATLYLLPRGGGTPVPLSNANKSAGLTNSYPKWAPLPDDDVLWLAFSSRRGYGTTETGLPQIWVAGIDPARAELGEDPSLPAFWLPGQNRLGDNHLPLWADE